MRVITGTARGRKLREPKNMPLIIITIGILYILEVLSDIIQVGYFKLSHGKRVFRMVEYDRQGHKPLCVAASDRAEVELCRNGARNRRRCCAQYER